MKKRTEWALFALVYAAVTGLIIWGFVWIAGGRGML